MPDESRFAIRSGSFLRIHESLRRTMPEVFDPTSFDAEDERALIALYFLISDSYKKKRVEPGHNTNDTKKAAITIAAVMAMRPLSFRGPEADYLKRFYTNPIFALACATAILKKPLHAGQDEDREQTYMWFDRLRFPSTIPFLVEAQAAPLTDAYADNVLQITLSVDELSTIDLIVQRMKTAVRLYELEAQVRDLTHDA
jgi:hypothetical protein